MGESYLQRRLFGQMRHSKTQTSISSLPTLKPAITTTTTTTTATVTAAAVVAAGVTRPTTSTSEGQPFFCQASCSTTDDNEGGGRQQQQQQQQSSTLMMDKENKLPEEQQPENPSIPNSSSSPQLNGGNDDVQMAVISRQQQSSQLGDENEQPSQQQQQHIWPTTTIESQAAGISCCTQTKTMKAKSRLKSASRAIFFFRRNTNSSSLTSSSSSGQLNDSRQQSVSRQDTGDSLGQQQSRFPISQSVSSFINSTTTNNQEHAMNQQQQQQQTPQFIVPKLNTLKLPIVCLIKSLDGELMREVFVHRYELGEYLIESLKVALGIEDCKYFGLKMAKNFDDQEDLKNNWLDLNESVCKQIKNNKTLLGSSPFSHHYQSSSNSNIIINSQTSSNQATTSNHAKAGYNISGGARAIDFYLRIKFYPPNLARVQDAFLRQYLWLQLRRDLRLGKLTSSMNNLTLLMACVLQYEFGDFNQELIEQIPKLNVLPNQDLIEEQASEVWRTRLVGLKRHQAQMQFLRAAVILETYGFDYWPVRDHQRQRAYLLGFNYAGIKTIRNGRIVHHFRWHSLSKISYERRMIIFHIYPTENSKRKQILGFKCLSNEDCQNLYMRLLEQKYFFTVDLAYFDKSIRRPSCLYTTATTTTTSATNSSTLDWLEGSGGVESSTNNSNQLDDLLEVDQQDRGYLPPTGIPSNTGPPPPPSSSSSAPPQGKQQQQQQQQQQRQRQHGLTNTGKSWSLDAAGATTSGGDPHMSVPSQMVRRPKQQQQESDELRNLAQPQGANRRPTSRLMRQESTMQYGSITTSDDDGDEEEEEDYGADHEEEQEGANSNYGQPRNQVKFASASASAPDDKEQEQEEEEEDCAFCWDRNCCSTSAAAFQRNDTREVKQDNNNSWSGLRFSGFLVNLFATIDNNGGGRRLAQFVSRLIWWPPSMWASVQNESGEGGSACRESAAAAANGRRQDFVVGGGGGGGGDQEEHEQPRSRSRHRQLQFSLPNLIPPFRVCLVILVMNFLLRVTDDFSSALIEFLALHGPQAHYSSSSSSNGPSTANGDIQGLELGGQQTVGKPSA